MKLYFLDFIMANAVEKDESTQRKSGFDDTENRYDCKGLVSFLLFEGKLNDI